MMNARLYRFWGHLTEALQTGLPQTESRHGEPDLFGMLYRDPARLEQLLAAMTGLSRPTARAVATAVERIQDVCGHRLRSGRAHCRDRAPPSASDRLRL
jgi:hypothetical protein